MTLDRVTPFETTATPGCGDGHVPVPVSRELHEPQDGKPTRWRCRHCGKPVDPITGALRRVS